MAKFWGKLSSAPDQWSIITLCGSQAIADHWSGAEHKLSSAPDPGPILSADIQQWPWEPTNCCHGSPGTRCITWINHCNNKGVAIYSSIFCFLYIKGLPEMTTFLITQFLDGTICEVVKAGLPSPSGRRTAFRQPWSYTVKSFTKCTIQEKLILLLKIPSSDKIEYDPYHRLQ